MSTRYNVPADQVRKGDRLWPGPNVPAGRVTRVEHRVGRHVDIVTTSGSTRLPETATVCLER